MARAHTAEAIAALVVALGNPRERVPAAIALLDRGWGKPAQRIETDGESQIHLHLLAALQVEPQTLEAPREPEQQQQRQPLVIDLCGFVRKHMR